MCYRAFSNGIMKEALDESLWSDLTVLIHQAKIETEDNFIQMLEREEQMDTKKK